MKQRYKMEYLPEQELSTIKDDYENHELTAEELTDRLNKYYDFITDLEPVLRQLNGRKLFDTEIIELSALLNKITEIKQ